MAINNNDIAKEIASNYEKYKEYSLSVDSFNRPLVFTGNDAVATLLVELIMLEPGTYPTRPKMGVGIVSRYRFSSETDLINLQDDISTQINDYLPEFTAVTVEATENNNKEINISIALDSVVYTLVFDKQHKTLNTL